MTKAIELKPNSSYYLYRAMIYSDIGDNDRYRKDLVDGKPLAEQEQKDWLALKERFEGKKS